MDYEALAKQFGGTTTSASATPKSMPNQINYEEMAKQFGGTTETSAPRQNVGAEMPAWAKENPRLYDVAQTVRKYAAPVVEMGGAIGGGIIGSGVGPAGTVGGAALGYGIGKEATHLADVYLGNVPKETPTQTALRGAENIVEGGMLEESFAIEGHCI